MRNAPDINHRLTVDNTPIRKPDRELREERAETFEGFGGGAGDLGGAAASATFDSSHAGIGPALNINPQQVQKKFKHAGDFGVSGG